MAIVRNLMVRAGADFSRLESATARMKSSMKNMNDTINRNVSGSAKSVGMLTGALSSVNGQLMAIAGAYLGIQGIKDSINDAVKLESQIGFLNRMLGDNANEYLQWADTTARAYGIGYTSAVEYGAQFSGMVSNFSKDSNEIVKRTEDLVKASTIVASGTGRSMDDVMMRMASGMRGETDAIEDLNVFVSESMINQSKAFQEMGNGAKTFGSIHSEQLKQQIRYYAILEQIQSKYGDTVAQNTGLKLRTFLSTLHDVKVALGTAFLPILNRVLPVLNAMAMGLLRVMRVIGAFTQALFGKAVFGGGSETKKTQQQTSAIHNQAGAVDGLTKSIKNLKNEKDKSSKSGGLAGFDQVNQLNSGSSSGSGGSGGIDGDGGTGITMPTPDTGGFNDAINGMYDNIGKVSDKIQDFVNNVKEWFKPIADAWEGLKDPFKHLGDAIVDVWNSDGFVKFRGWLATVTQLAIVKALEEVGKGIDYLADALEVIADMLNGDWSKAWDDFKGLLDETNPLLAGLTASVVAFFIATNVTKFLEFLKALEVWKVLTGEMTIVQYAMNLAMELNPVGMLVIGIGALVGTIILLYQNWDTVTKAMTTCWDKMKEFGSDVANFGVKLWNGITSGWGDLKQWLSDNFVNVVLIALNPLAFLGKTIYGYITSNWGSISDWFKTNVVDKVTGSIASLSNLGTTIWGYIKNFGASVWEWVKTNVVDKFTGSIGNLSGLGKKIFGYIKDFGGSVWAWVHDNVSVKFTDAIGGLSGLGKKIFGYIKNFGGSVWTWTHDNVSVKFKSAIGGLSSVGKTIWGYVKAGFTNVKSWFTNNVASPIKSVLNNIGSGVGSGIKNVLKSVWNPIANTVNNMLDDMAGIEVFGAHPLKKVNDHKLPKLAKGGITNGEMTAIIGDNAHGRDAGREVVSPLSSLKDLMGSTVTNAIMTAMQFQQGNNNGGSSNQLQGDIIFNVDGRTFARIVKPYLDQETKRVGTNVRLTNI